MLFPNPRLEAHNSTGWRSSHRCVSLSCDCGSLLHLSLRLLRERNPHRWDFLMLGCSEWDLPEGRGCLPFRQGCPPLAWELPDARAHGSLSHGSSLRAGAVSPSAVGG